MTTPEIVLRAVGPAANGGRLPLAELARLAGGLQSALERIASVLRGTTDTAGRRSRSIVDSVRLELTGFHAGSAVLEIRPPSEAMIEHALLTDSMDVLMRGASAIAARTDTPPENFTPQVLDGIVQFSGGLSAGGIDHLEISWRDERSVRIDRGFRDHAKWLRHQSERDVVTIVGRLHEGDFDPLALRCRIDAFDLTIPCSFTADLRDLVLEAMASMVIAVGIAELRPDGRPRSLELDELTVIDESRRRTVAQLAREQDVRPFTDLSDFGDDADMDDDEFHDFITSAMSARS